MWEARANALRSFGFDVLTALGAGNEALSDAGQLAFATSEGRLIVTANARDYSQLHREWMDSARNHSGIVLALQEYGYSPGEFARRMLRLAVTLNGAPTTNLYVHLSSFHDYTSRSAL